VVDDANGRRNLLDDDDDNDECNDDEDDDCNDDVYIFLLNISPSISSLSPASLSRFKVER